MTIVDTKIVVEPTAGVSPAGKIAYGIFHGMIALEFSSIDTKDSVRRTRFEHQLSGLEPIINIFRSVGLQDGGVSISQSVKS